ncbi:MAG TPA: hypothetical protein VEB86_09095 [Chryseosolibacter sp.]|nr:hypothetical protein [Chryseosolibacter sp.]
MFRSEKELVSTITLSANFLVHLIPDDLQNTAGSLSILQEANLGHGVPDLILAKYDSSTGILCRSQRLNYKDLAVYTIIGKQEAGIDFETLKDKTKLSNSGLRKILTTLETEGMIVDNEGDYTITSDSDNLGVEVVAIEAKLKNWKRALKQAYRYKWFASYSYVFLDEQFIQPAVKNKSLFKSYNVGLASVNRDGVIDVKLRPQRVKPYDDAMHFLVREHLLFGTKE